jgi:hypothetical protein
MGPWVGGWAIITGPHQRRPGRRGGELQPQVLRLDSLASKRPVVVALPMICDDVDLRHRHQISARVQRHGLAQVGSSCSSYRRRDRHARQRRRTRRRSAWWFSPVGLSARDLLPASTGVFCHWESGSTQGDRRRGGGSQSQPVATVLLVITYVGSAVAVLGVLGLSTLRVRGRQDPRRRRQPILDPSAGC